jgi:hypothetical protein
MSKRSGDKAKSKKEREKKRRRRLHDQELRRATKNKAAGREADPDRDGNRIVSSQLRRVARDSKDGSDQGEDVLEIVVYRTRGNTE